MTEKNVSIRRLDETVASRIAAGEVIERPVSAAKEMLENSIDAGASNVKIALSQGGRASLVIEDDGSGIAWDDIPLTIERHATSKISTLEDLEHVRTLGYRGEALASIAAVSRMELHSRRRDDDSGGVIKIEGGMVVYCSRVPCMPGTRVQVDDLFYNLPARRKFLKSASSELKRIIQVVQDYAVARPGIRFRVSNDGKEMLDIGNAANTDELLASLWGQESRSVRAEARSSEGALVLWWNALPGSKRVTLTAFVNGRRVQDSTIRSALNATGASIFGEWIVMLDIRPEDVDVNVHPAKAEVRFRHQGAVFELVLRGAKKALLAGGGFREDAAALNFPPSPHETSQNPWEHYIPEMPKIGKHAHSIASGADDAPGGSLPGGTKDLFADEELGASRKYLGQAQGGYLVFDDPRGLCLVDAHAAHERILYEGIEDSFSESRAVSQSLLSPQELPPAVAAAVIQNRDELSNMGFAFHFPPDDGEPVMTSLPALQGLGRLSPLEMLRSALKGIEEETDPSKRDREVWWRWARTACRDAMKLGEIVECSEALALFDRLEKCRQPYSCPHGRPTTIFLAGEKLKSWFER
ncbi:MAG: DNA mismatch repair endonuclease MutL [Synergistaceae bacterium]|jgi:DNA mismatch repair protein MutL|nr:DNA mismatch repair endonuclease MutL [Synergistaceae bacterium]